MRIERDQRRSLSRAGVHLLLQSNVLAVGLVLLGGCQGGLFGKPPQQPAQQPGPESSEIRSADTAFTPDQANPPPATGLPQRRAGMLSLAVLNVEIPAKELDATANIWTHLNESQIDAETSLRLSRNGLRVGVASLSAYEPIRVILESIPRHRATQPPPLSVPAGLPLVLEMDAEPHDQTVFCVGTDGVLSGGTWTGSRSVLRVTYNALPRDARRMRFAASPEIVQREEGYRWIRTEAGLWQQPNEKRFVFEAAGFSVELDPGDFVLIGPSELSRSNGIVGGALLSREYEGERYYSIVFLRPQVSDVAERN